MSQKARLTELSRLPAAAPRPYVGAKNVEHAALARMKIEQNVKFVFNGYEVAESRLLCTNEWAFMPIAFVELSKKLLPVKLSGLVATEKVIAIWKSQRGISIALDRICGDVASILEKSQASSK